MRPFIPDYIPAVGEIDSFVKETSPSPLLTPNSAPTAATVWQVPRPDGKADQLGLVVMDEPSANQSDPTVLTLQLRAVTKASPPSFPPSTLPSPFPPLSLLPLPPSLPYLHLPPTSPSHPSGGCSRLARSRCLCDLSRRPRKTPRQSADGSQ